MLVGGLVVVDFLDYYGNLRGASVVMWNTEQGLICSTLVFRCSLLVTCMFTSNSSGGQHVVWPPSFLYLYA